MPYTLHQKAILCAQGLTGSVNADDSECAMAMETLFGDSGEQATVQEVMIRAHDMKKRGELVEDRATGRMQSRLAPPVSQDQIADVLRVTRNRGPKNNYDLWLEVAVPAMAQAAGGPQAKSETSRRLADRLGFKGMVQRDLEMRGITIVDRMEMTTWVEANSQRSGLSEQVIPLDMAPVSNAFTGSGAFPSALGGVLDVLLTDIPGSPEVTFPRWSRRMMDAEDFRPQSLCAIGGVGELTLNMTTKSPAEMNINEESGLLVNDIYDGQISWTPQQQSNGPDVLAMGIEVLNRSHDLTLERLHFNRLMSAEIDNGFDGNPIFSSGTLGSFTPSARGNIIATSGGGPSSAQFGLMRKHGRGQVQNKTLEDGSWAKFYPGALKAILFGSDWEEQAYEACPQPREGEKNYRPEPIFMPMLDEQADTKNWFGIFSAAAFMVHVFQRGYGPNGKSIAWRDPLTGVLHVKKEGRFGCGTLHPQCGIRNNGA
jgi:hypothetical protein